MSERSFFNQTLSIILAFILLTTALPLTAFAEEGSATGVLIEEKDPPADAVGDDGEVDTGNTPSEEEDGNVLDGSSGGDGFESEESLEGALDSPELNIGEGFLAAEPLLMQLAPRISGTIASIFPDPLFASYIAGLLAKSPNSTVTQNELNTITQVNPSGAVHNIEGIQYLYGLKEARLDNLQLTQRIPEGFVNNIRPNLSFYIANNQRFESTPITLATHSLEEVYLHTPPIFKQIAQNSGGAQVGNWVLRGTGTTNFYDSFPAVDGAELLQYNSLPDGTYNLELQLKENIWMGLDGSIYVFPVTVNVGSNTGTLQGTVTDAVTGNRISGAKVTVKSGSTTEPPQFTDGNGSYIFSNLPVRNYTITVEKDGYYTQAKSATVKNTQVVVVDFQLVPYYGSVEGKVLDKDTLEPIAGATITPDAASGAPEKTTDANGNFYYTFVNAGAYDATASALGYLPETESATFTGNQTEYVVFLLEKQKYTLSGYVYVAPNMTSPINGAVVTVPLADGTSVSGTTNNQGSYSINTRFINGSYIATAGAGGYSTEQETFIINNADQTQDFYLLPSAYDVTVGTYHTGIDPGNELEGVTLTLTDIQNGWTQSVVTDSSGSFTGRLVNGSYRIEAEKTGYKIEVTGGSADSPYEFEINNGGLSINFVFEPIVAVVEGTVYKGVTDDFPLDDASVTLVDSKGVTHLAAQTEVAGTYSFPNVPYGPFTILAEKNGYSSEFFGDLQVDGSTGTITQNFHLYPDPINLTAKVYFLDENGGPTTTPVPGATAHLVNDSRTDTTGASGEVTAALVPGDYSAYVVYNGYTTSIKDAVLPVGGPDQELIFYVPQGATLKGTVTDALTGDPVAGATVTLPGASDRTTTTDSSGDYVFYKVIPGTYNLTASADDYQTSLHAGVVVPDNAITSEDFKLIPSLSMISGTVVETDLTTTTPVQGAVITLKDATGATVLETTDTNADGYYSFVVLAGSYVVEEAYTGYTSQVKTAETLFNQNEIVDFELMSLGKLEGLVTDTQGNPIAGVVITAYPEDDVFGPKYYTTTTDANGFYHFDGVPAGSGVVVASKAGYGTQGEQGVVVKNQITVIDFVLEDNPGTLTGTVTTSDGRPIAGAEIVIGPDGIKLTTDANGRYEIPLTAGDYTITITYNGVTQTREVTITANQTTTEDFVFQVKANNNDNKGKGTARTGDESPFAFFAVFAGLAGLALVIARLRQRQAVK